MTEPRMIVAVCLYPSFLRGTRTVSGALLKVTYENGTRDYWKLDMATARRLVSLIMTGAKQ